jgi:hypothetical protein
MLTEAVNYGVRMYDYDELKVKHSKVFEQQFAIQRKHNGYLMP